MFRHLAGLAARIGAGAIGSEWRLRKAADFVLRAGDTLIAPRDIPHQLRNSGNAENHYLLVFSPSGLEGFLEAMAISAPDDAAAPTEPPAVPVRNVHELAADYGILFG